ncbi:hypothetical protein [Paracoccus ravus]|uniref:hypothetical protein n=1 Tax=Paracoccus ravus TaxID=2447760 RepID=UPI00106E0D86|nr:hypothetical protein [Paracoccus ravus]
MSSEEDSTAKWIEGLQGADALFVSQVRLKPEFVLQALIGAREQGSAQDVANIVEAGWPLIYFGLLSMMKTFKHGPYQPKPSGRKRVPQLQSLDARRAFRVWGTARACSRAQDSTRDLIQLTREIEKLLFPKDPRESLFAAGVSDETAEQSVSRGRAILKISDGWQSALCEELAE